MDQARWQQIEHLYHFASELPPGDRAAYLDAACAGDDALHHEVNSLLAEAAHQDGFLSDPTLTLGLSLLANEQSTSLDGGQFGQYTIIKQLGRGGMGEVYLAKDTRLGRPVALKLLPIFLDGSDVNVLRFEREARAASGVSHPNVAHVYEIGEASGRHYIAMEYVEAQTLRALIGCHMLSPANAVRIALQVASALAAAHAAGVVHRDVKPENILVRSDGLVKVVDFGLAKLAGPGRSLTVLNSVEPPSAGGFTHTVRTQPGVLMGTVNYMSPEQARGQDVDARADIWSWGVVFYEMLVGQPPFIGATSSDVIAEILKGELPPLQGIPDSLSAILRKSLNKEREERYAGMVELLDDLRELARQVERSSFDFPLTQNECVQMPHEDSPPHVAPVAQWKKTVPDFTAERSRGIS